MNIELQYSVDFSAMIYTPEGPVWPLMANTYAVSMQLLTVTKNKKDINIALERLKVFLFSELAHTVFVNREYSEHTDMLQILGSNVTQLPEEPVDQVIGIMLYCKLNAIMENRMQITQLDIASQLGDNIWYKHGEDDDLGPFCQDGWWHKPSVQHQNDEQLDTPANVVNLQRTGWVDYGLSWSDDIETAGNTVVYANFPRHENQ